MADTTRMLTVDADGLQGEPRDFAPEDAFAFFVSHSPDGRYMATVGGDGVVRLWDPNTGEVLKQVIGAPNINGPSDESPWFSRDGSLMITTFDGAVRLWDIETGTQIGDAFPHDPPAEAGGAEGETLQLVTAVGDHILIWNLDTSTWYDIACRAAGRSVAVDRGHQLVDGRAVVVAPLGTLRCLGGLVALLAEKRCNGVRHYFTRWSSK